MISSGTRKKKKISSGTCVTRGGSLRARATVAHPAPFLAAEVEAGSPECPRRVHLDLVIMSRCGGHRLAPYAPPHGQRTRLGWMPGSAALPKVALPSTLLLQLPFSFLLWQPAMPLLALQMQRPPESLPCAAGALLQLLRWMPIDQVASTCTLWWWCSCSRQAVNCCTAGRHEAQQCSPLLMRQ